MRGVFVTGTDTEVGKSVVAASICAALVARGERVAAFKPVVTGLDDDPGEFGRDHELLAANASAGQSPAEVAPHSFGPPVSPHLAAELAGMTIEPRELVAAARSAAPAGNDSIEDVWRPGLVSSGDIDPGSLAARGGGDSAPVLVCEGVGGLMVPITPGYLVRDLAVDLALPVVVAARTGLGTINHTLLTVEAARAAGLTVAGVVMTPWPDEPTIIEESNRATVERLAGVAVSALPPTAPDRLAEAGAVLPIDDWL